MTDHAVAPTGDLCGPDTGSAANRPERDRVITWFGRWREQIKRWGRDSVPPSDVDDLAQEVFLRLLRYSDEAVIRNPKHFLFRIATNVASEWRERVRLRRPHDDCWLEEIESSDEPENTVAQLRRNEYLRAAVDRLTPRQSDVVLLHVNEGLTSKQIAELRGLTYRIVVRDLAHAYSQLRLEVKLEDL